MSPMLQKLTVSVETVEHAAYWPHMMQALAWAAGDPSSKQDTFRWSSVLQTVDATQVGSSCRSFHMDHY